MADDNLQQAISLIKTGKNDEARGLLYHLVKTDPHNEMAWLWLSETMNASQKQKTLEQAIRFNPDSQKIQHALQRLGSQQKEEPRPAPPIPTSAMDRASIKTAQLAFLPDELPGESAPTATPIAKPKPPAAKPEDRTLIQTTPLPPLPSQIDRSLIHTARLEMPPDELLPDNLPPELQLPDKPAPPPQKGIDRSTMKTAQLEYVPEEPAAHPAPEAKPAPVLPPQAATVKMEKPPVQAPTPPDKIDRSLIRTARFEQTSEAPKTGPLPVPPPMAAQPVKPEPGPTEEPVSAMRSQMDALLTEPHPSPDPVKAQGPKPVSAPPAPPLPPNKKEAIAPKGRRRRRISGLEVALIIIAVLLVIGIIGFVIFDFFILQPVVPTPAAVLPAPTQVTATRPATNTPQATPTPIPPPTLRPTFTPLVSPTPTLNPDSSSVMFIDPTSCLVKQVSAGGGAAQLLTDPVPANCLSPELAPDGSKFAYLAQNAISKAVNSLYVANFNGTSQKALVDKNASPIWELDWAPDNTWLSYTAAVGTNKDNPPVGIYLIRADGSGQVQLTNDLTPSIISDNNNAVSWSPDGQWIAFYADNRPYIVKPNGTGLKQLSEDAGLSVIAWSPDSRQIAYYSSDLNNPGIVIVGVDGRQAFAENSALKVPISGDALLWTPDGKQFAVYDVAKKELVLVSRSGAQITPLAAVNGIPTRLTWSPDGTQIAYLELPQQDSASGVLKVVKINGTDLTTLVTSAANAPIRWKVPVNFAGTVTPAPVINVPAPAPSPTP
jgi:Tol biopolymer transport system component